MSFIASAIGGAGLLSAGASIYGSNQQANAASNAANLQKQQMAQNQSNMQPFISGGQGASNLLQSFYGIGGGGPHGSGITPALSQSALASFNASPDYQFALNQGTAALDNSAAARGGMISGNQLQAQTQYGQGLATQNLGNYLNRLSGMAGQGVQAASGIASPNTAGAAYAGNSMMAGATAQMAGLSGATGAVNQGINNYLTLGGGSSYGGGTPNYLGQTGTQNIGGYTMPQF
jgi:hypothetical protein